MDLLTLLWLVLAILCFSRNSLSIASIYSISPKDKWPRHDRPQDIHSTLINLADKIRIVENMRYTMNRWDMILDRIEVQTSKIQAMFQRVSTIEDKHEVIMDRMRKFENNFERINTKMSSLESKLDDSTKKIQVDQEMSFLKTENKLIIFNNKLDDIILTTKNLNDNTNILEKKINSTNEQLFKHLANIKNKVDDKQQFNELTTRLDGIHNHLNQTDSMSTQNDGPRVSEKDKEMMIDTIRIGLNIESQKFGNKISNMYHDIWKKINEIEIMSKEGSATQNKTNEEIVKNLRNLLIEQRESESFIDLNVEKVIKIFSIKLKDLSKNMEINFENMMSTQNVFLDTCHRLQEEEPLLESRVTEVLEKLLDNFLNRTEKIEKRTVEIIETIKSHNTQEIRSSSQTKDMIATLAEEISQDHKNLYSTITDVSETVSSNVQEIEDDIHDLNETLMTHPVVEKYRKLFSYLAKALNVTKENQIEETEANFNDGVIKVVDINDSKEKSNELENKSEITEKPKIKEEINSDAVSKLMLTYIKLVKGHITLREFLKENSTEKKYKTVTDLIKHMKGSKNVPKEFIRELDQYVIDAEKFGRTEPEDDSFTYDDAYDVS